MNLIFPLTLLSVFCMLSFALEPKSPKRLAIPATVLSSLSCIGSALCAAVFSRNSCIFACYRQLGSACRLRDAYGSLCCANICNIADFSRGAVGFTSHQVISFFLCELITSNSDAIFKVTTHHQKEGDSKYKKQHTAWKKKFEHSLHTVEGLNFQTRFCCCIINIHAC